jgi:hypothetical protein
MKLHLLDVVRERLLPCGSRGQWKKCGLRQVGNDATRVGKLPEDLQRELKILITF